MAPTIYSTRLNKKEPTRDRIKSALNEEDFKVLQNIVLIDKLYQSTLTQYGNQIYAPTDSGPYPELSDNELIGQFQQMYCQQIQGQEVMEISTGN